jgi:hypothetical protein
MDKLEALLTQLINSKGGGLAEKGDKRPRVDIYPYYCVKCNRKLTLGEAHDFGFKGCPGDDCDAHGSEYVEKVPEQG